MPSKQKSEPEFNGRVGSFPSCCGIGVLERFSWSAVKVTMVRPWYNPNGPLEPYKRRYPLSRVTNKRIIPALKSVIEDGFKQGEYDVILAALPDNTAMYKQHLNLLKKLGWTELTVSKSKHGDYHIHTLEMKASAWEKARKLYAV